MIPLRSVVPGALSHVIRQAPLTPEKVAFAWRLAVGPALERATTVRLGDDGVLDVTAETPAWTAAVRKSTGMIETRLEEWLGAGVVTSLRVHD